jgi:hypothetical protein
MAKEMTCPEEEFANSKFRVSQAGRKDRQRIAVRRDIEETQGSNSFMALL